MPTLDPQPYVDLAVQVLRQAVNDAYASRTTHNPDSTMPTPADVADARAFLASPAALHLADCLDMHPGHVARIVARPPARAAPWPTVAQAARALGYHPEHVRNLIRRGRLAATRDTAGGHAWRVNPASLDSYRDSLLPLHRA